MVSIPRPTATVVLGSETVIMFTMGMIMQTTPIRANIVSSVRSSVVPLWNMKRPSPRIMTNALRKSIGLGPWRATARPASGPIASIASVAGAIVRPVAMIPRPSPKGPGDLGIVDHREEEEEHEGPRENPDQVRDQHVPYAEEVEADERLSA